ncbi:MAG: 50S ribosomal protein L9 [Armatimonadetes bacterium]|nr:50S ribosomal protein L9 [Armatimonadota bacterium]
MKVILNQTVPKLGKTGQVVTVKDGYARNYLFPKGLAIFADRGQLKTLDRKNERMAAKLAETKASAEATKAKIDGQLIKIEGKVGRDLGKLFGAITSQDVADAIKKELGVDVEKKDVCLIEPIKRIGKHAVMVDLHRDVDAHITVQVFDPAHPELDVEAAAPVAEEAPEASEPEAEAVEA